MKNFIHASVLALLVACALAPLEAPDDEETATAKEAMTWKPIERNWKDCIVNGRRCRCFGNIEDCQEATEKESKKQKKD